VPNVDCNDGVSRWDKRSPRRYDEAVARILIASTAASRPERAGAHAASHLPGGCEIEWVSPLVVTPRFAEAKRALGRLAEFRSIALTSPHAVDAMVGALRALGHDVRALFGLKLCAVGDSTAIALGRHGLSADLIAEGGGAELAREMLSAHVADPVLFLRAADGRPELADVLGAGGLRVEVASAYETAPDGQAIKAALLRHASEPYAAIGLASPRGAEAIAVAFGVGVRGVVLGAIGATTAAALSARKLDALVPERPSLDALITLLCDAVVR
jgi:uroporphyrinogen III methyltransferase/synthase